MDAERLETLEASLAELEAQEREVSARRRQLHDRLAVFNSAYGEEQERAISAERKALHDEIDRLKAERDLLRGQAGK